MVRIALFVILAVWLIGAEEVSRPAVEFRPGLAVFLGGYVVLLAVIAIWARVLSRRVLNAAFYRSSRKFNRFVHYARWAIPVWLAAGFLSEVGWGQLVLGLTGKAFQSPALLLGTLPAVLTWVGIWWAEYPADLARREQMLAAELMNNLPVHAPPGFGRAVGMAIRQQLLPVLLPILIILVLRDVLILALGTKLAGAWEQLVLVLPALGMYLIAPELLRRLFDTRPLAASPLREKLEGICRRSNLKYRDILLWQTDFSVANAAVFGILPRWRYVMLSDRLLETMNDEHVEAVFAHEMGHIVHRHLMWYIVFFVTLTLLATGPGTWAEKWLVEQFPSAFSDGISRGVWRVGNGVLSLVGTLFLMSVLARRFEKQADVHAARLMQDYPHEAEGTGEEQRHLGVVPLSGSGDTYVGPRGAEIYGGALRRVAVVNDIPLSASDLFHPSIRKRLEYIEGMAQDPERTRRFDRQMKWMYAGLLGLLVGLVGFMFLDV